MNDNGSGGDRSNEDDAGDNVNGDNDNDDDVQDRQCVVCMDAVANMMFMPCNHIALCQNCYDDNTFEKCAFCGCESSKVIKCYHVGF